jgi:hypothetical protein
MKKFLLVLTVLLSVIAKSQPGAALNFDGSNDYVNLPNVNTPFNVSSAHIKTFQLWFKNTMSQGSHVRIFSTGTAGWTSGVWFGYAAGSPFLRLELSDGLGPAGVAITGTTNIRGDNQWHQATGVLNGTLATLYLDGLIQGTVSISGEGAMNPPGQIHIGNSYNNESGSYFMGNVDELRVWDKALCTGEIMATMNCELTGSEPGLVAYYKFNQGIAGGSNSTTNSLPDLTINGNNGTLTNFLLSGTTSNWVTPGGVTTGNTCAPFTASAEIDLVGNSISIMDGDVTPNISDNTDFGAICQNKSITQIFSIVNTGTTSLGITSISFSGVDASMFSAGTFPSSIGVSSSATFAVTFTATSTGLKNAKILIHNTDCDESPYDFDLTAYVNSLPTVVITSTNATCSGNTVNLIGGGANTYTWSTGPTTNSIAVSPSITSTYTLTGAASNGCVNTATKTITVYQIPAVSINGPNSICIGNFVNLIGSGGNTYTWSTSSNASSITVFPTSTSSYSLSITDANGCTNSTSKTITVNPLPILGVSSTSSLLCYGYTATLTATGANTYSWSNSSTGNPIAISPSVTTSYTVTGTDANGCTNSTMITQNVDDCTGIFQLTASGTSLVVYPNPFLSSITIKLDKNSYSEVKIYNMIGELVYSSPVENDKFSVDLSDKASGVYFISVSGKTGKETQKLIKQ